MPRSHLGTFLTWTMANGRGPFSAVSDYQPTFIQAFVWQRLIFEALHSEGESLRGCSIPQIVTMAIRMFCSIYIYLNLWLPSLVLAWNILSLSHGKCLWAVDAKVVQFLPAIRCVLLQIWKERDRNWGFHLDIPSNYFPRWGFHCHISRALSFDLMG